MADTTHVSPRSRATAEALLSAAEQLGYESRVVAVSRNGYIVPVDVAELFSKMLAGETQPVDKPADAPDEESDQDSTPTSDWKNADIKDWADAHDVDLGGATTKADMLAAIAAEKEE